MGVGTGVGVRVGDGVGVSVGVGVGVSFAQFAAAPLLMGAMIVPRISGL